MISFFPDLNIWLALSVADHSHNVEAWRWLGLLPKDARLIFSRYTQIGLLRLLTNQAVMGEETLTLHRAWGVYDRWLDDPRVDFYPEPHGLDAAFREATAPFAAKPASKWVGDCYLLAYAKESGASLVTFDKALLGTAHKRGYAAILPA
jgi:toxin-antitoxin system PIN domain toxin